MSSILKILVDIQCLVYCDFEQVGEASPNSIFKMELRKGMYIIEFRKDDISLKSIKYKIESNDEDYLLEESLASIYVKEKETKRRKEISGKKVTWINVGDKWRITSVDDYILNSVTGESWVDLPNSYILLPMGQHKDSDIDVCGYIPFNIGGTLKKDDLKGSFISGGKWGCLDKSGKVVIQPIYSHKVFFQNDQVTSTYNCCVFAGVINTSGEKVFSEFDHVFPIDEVLGYYDVSMQNKHGIINKYGDLLLPFSYLEFGYHTSKAIWALDPLSSKWGFIGYDSTIVLPFIYDKVNDAEDGYFVCKNERWGAVDLDGKVIVDTKYNIVTKVTKQYYNPNNQSGDSDYLYNCYSIVTIFNDHKGCKYGIVNTIFEKNFASPTATIAFKEIIPCKYDAVYSNWGKHYTDEQLVEAASSQLGYSDGYFEIADVYFVIKRNHIQCDRYDDKGNITYSFTCDEFNSKYKILSHKYYLRKADSQFDDHPYDTIKSIDFYDGTLFDKCIYPDDWDGYTGVPPEVIIDERCKTSFLIGKKDTKWYVFDNRESNCGSYKNLTPNSIIFSYECDEIVEFGDLLDREFFAIVKIGIYKKLFIINDNKIVYESDCMLELHSSYYELTFSTRAYNEKYKINSLNNDYFIAQLTTHKWQIIKCHRAYDSCSGGIFKSSEYDFMRFIDESTVEIQLNHNGRTLYNTMSIDCWDDLKPYCNRWKVSPYVERNCNWVAVYDFETEKEGIVIEEHNKLSEIENPVYGGYDIVGKVPEEIIIPFKWDYARMFYSEKNPIIAVGNYTDKKVGNYLGAKNELRCAIMDTKKQFLSNFIFGRITTGLSCQDLCFHIGGYMVNVNLVQDDIVYSIPFLNYESYDKNGKCFKGSPFNNVKLFIDTETTGLPLNDKLPYTNLDNWPHLVQVALIIEDENYGVLSKRNFILKPDGYSIPECSTKIHGISNERAVKDGEDRNKVLSFLDIVLYNSDIVIGHNVSFDINVIKSEIIRVKGIENAFFVKKNHYVIDTMKLGMDICKIPNLSFYSRRSQPYKYPKLDELYYKLFNKHLVNQHDAMADVQATYDCYYELKRKTE